MQRVSSIAVMNLMAATCSRRGEDCLFQKITRGGKQHKLADLHQNFVMLAFISERTGHAAATGGNLTNRICFARRGKSDRTQALLDHLERTRQKFLAEQNLQHESKLEILPSYPWEQSCLQIADYCLWALQRCYERHEARFLHAL